jgi:hypothetical protein
MGVKMKLGSWITILVIMLLVFGFVKYARAYDINKECLAHSGSSSFSPQCKPDQPPHRVPEPGTLLLVGAGLAALKRTSKLRKKK